MRWVGRLQLTFLTFVCLLPSLALAQRFPVDPVDRLRTALGQGRQVPEQVRDPAANKSALEYRKELLTARAGAVRTLGDLSRALLLQDWGLEARDRALDLDVTLIEEAVFKSLEDRFKKGATEALETGEPAVRRATAALLAETASAARSSGGGDHISRVQELVTGLTPALVAAARSPDAEVRAAAARAMGLITPQPKAGVEALERILERDTPGPRRAAAGALHSLMLVAFESERKSGGTKRTRDLRTELRETGSLVIAAAGNVLARPDPDPVVRRLAAEAMQTTAFGLSEVVAVPPTLSFPPEGRSPWSKEEKQSARDHADKVAGELQELNPLLESLVSNIRSLSRTLTDLDVTVRLAAARAIEDVAAARDKVRLLRASVPRVPEDKPIPDPTDKPNGNELKKDARRSEPLEGMKRIVHLVRQVDQPLDARARAELAETIKDLAAALQDRDVRVRLAAVEALELFGSDARPAGNALAGALRDRDHFVRWGAARTLGRIAPVATEAALPGLVAMLADPDLDLRIAGASALGDYGPEGAPAVPALTCSVNRGDAEIRVVVMEALTGIGVASAPAIPEVIKALDHEDARVREAAAEFLGTFGRIDPHDKAATAALASARTAVPRLRDLLNDESPNVRKAVSEALLNLLPTP